MSDISAISRAIDKAGGQVSLQKRLEKQGVVITQQGISHWKQQGYAIKQHHSAISKAVYGKVRVADLKADWENRKG